MDDATARAMIQAHFDASNVSAPGGGPGDDIARASEIYADDAVVEWPQGGERLRGKVYFGDPWEPPAWRAQWVERFDRVGATGATTGRPSVRKAGRKPLVQ
jgi:hypothetical protein